jgi:putative membrane protein
MKVSEHDTLARNSNFIINLISIIVPLVVAVLLAFPNKFELGLWTKNLPHIIGSVNSLTTLVLIVGLISIKLGKINFHRYSMISAFLCGFVFLICYVTYHLSNPSNKFSGEGAVRYLYLIILLTHILLSLVVLPLVLRAMFYGLTKQFVKHKRIVKFAYPIWLYVSVTGVIVYLMLYQLFPSS